MTDLLRRDRAGCVPAEMERWPGTTRRPFKPPWRAPQCNSSGRSNNGRVDLIAMIGIDVLFHGPCRQFHGGSWSAASSDSESVAKAALGAMNSMDPFGSLKKTSWSSRTDVRRLRLLLSESQRVYSVDERIRPCALSTLAFIRTAALKQNTAPGHDSGCCEHSLPPPNRWFRSAREFALRPSRGSVAGASGPSWRSK